MTNASVAALLLRLVVSLGIVILLMALLARLARGRLGRVGRRASDPSLQLQVLSRQRKPSGTTVTVWRSP